MTRPPDLSRRPFTLTVDRVMPLPAQALDRAFTEQIDGWFADPGSVLMRAEVDAPFFFETVHRLETQASAERHPRLTHAGFTDDESRRGHARAWPFVLAQLEQRRTRG